MADPSTATVQKTKEEKEKLPKMEVVKSPVQKEIAKGFERRGADFNSDVERKEHGFSVEKKTKEKTVEKKDTKKNLFNKVSQVAGMEGDKEVVDEFYETFNDEKKLGKQLDEYEKLKMNESWLLKVMGNGNGGNSDTRDKMGAIIDKYVSDERITAKDGTTQWEMKTFEEVMGKDKNMNFISKFWFRLTHPIEYAKYMAVQKQAKYLRFGKSADKFADKVETIKDEGSEKLEYGKKVFDQTKEEKRKVMTQMRAIKIEKREKLGEFTKFKEKWSADMKNANKNIATWGPEKYNDEIAKLSKRGVKDIQKMGPEAIQAVGAGKVPGMKLGKVGSVSMISVGVMTLKEALRSRSFGEFSATVTESNWLWSVAELLPIIGTIRSAGRLNDESLGTSKGMRWAELGINVGLDVFTVLTLGLGSGAAAGIRVLLKGGTKGISKLGAKALAKKAGKELFEEGVEMTVKKTGKKEIGTVSEKVISKSIAKAGAKTTKETALSTMKTTLSKTTGKSWKKVWGHMPWKHAGYEGITEGASFSWNKFGPPNQTFAQAAVNVGMKATLTSNQMRAVNMVRNAA